MATITVMIESYGMIKTVLPSTLHVICDEGSDVGHVLQKIAVAHSNSRLLLEQCACAIGDQMVSRQTLLHADSALVLLSPVAGG